MQQSLHSTAYPARAPLTDRGARVLGSLMLLTGAAAVIFPLASGVAASLYLGGLIVVASVLKLAHKSPASSVGGRTLDKLGAALGVAAGVLLLVFPLTGLLTLTLLVAAYFVAQGALKLLATAQWAGRGRGWLAFGAGLDIVLGVLAFVGWPTAAGWFIGLLLGAHLALNGLMLLLGGREATEPPAPATDPEQRITGSSPMPTRG